MNTTSEAKITPVEPVTASLRFTLFVHGVILPCVLIGLSLSGREAHTMFPFMRLNFISAHAAMMLRPVAWFPFAPVILYSIICMATWTVSPSVGDRLWVRMGITLGVPLSLQFWVLLVAIFHAPMLVVTLYVWIAWQSGMALLKVIHRRQVSIWQILVLMTLAALVAACIQYYGMIQIPGKMEILGKVVYYGLALVALSLLIAAPGLNFVAYCRAAHCVPWPNPASPPLELLRQKRWRLGWIFYWVCALRWTILTGMNQYLQLSYTVCVVSSF